MPWAKRAKRPVPSTGAPTRSYEMNDYSAGMNSYVSNDKFPVKDGGTNMWRLAQNARIRTLGDYESRQGFDYLSDPAGEAIDQSITSGAGGNIQGFDENRWMAQKFTSAQNAPLSRIDVSIKNTTDGTGTILVELWSDASGVPGSRLSRSSIPASIVTTSFVYRTARFPDAPTLVSGTVYWIVLTVQPSGINTYKWASTTSATTALTSTDSGSSWTTGSFAMNFKEYYATTGGVKGLHRAVKSDGTKVTLFAHGTVLYKADETTGAITAIKTGLNTNASRYRFVTVNDVVYYVNGYDGYRKWDFTTESQVNASNYTDLVVHKGLMFLVDATDPNKFVWSNFGLYETFTSTDFQYIPAPKTGDPIAAMTPINGYMLFRTRNRCFMLSGDQSANFTVDVAPDQKGTYSPETCVSDKNYSYFLSSDGVYRSNGTQPELISENIYTDINLIGTKDGAILAVNKGRLYMWFASAGSAYNDNCYVWNLNYKTSSDTVESLDTKAYVSRAVSAFQDDDEMIVASSVLGQVYYQELASNDYTNLGGDIEFELQTHYMTGSSPAVLKEVRYWQPRFGAQDDNYTIACDYAYDLRPNWQTHSEPDVQGVGSIWGNAAMVWGQFTWGATSETQAQLYIPGEYRRVAVRYKHYATRQPQQFFGHSFRVQERRMR